MEGVGQFLLQMAVAIGSGSVLAPILAAIFSRQRTRAESVHLSASATTELTKAAGEVASIYSKLQEQSAKRISELELALAGHLAARQSAERRLASALSLLENAGIDTASVR